MQETVKISRLSSVVACRMQQNVAVHFVKRSLDCTGLVLMT